MSLRDDLTDRRAALATFPVDDGSTQVEVRPDHNIVVRGVRDHSDDVVITVTNVDDLADALAAAKTYRDYIDQPDRSLGCRYDCTDGVIPPIPGVTSPSPCPTHPPNPHPQGATP